MGNRKDASFESARKKGFGQVEVVGPPMQPDGSVTMKQIWNPDDRPIPLSAYAYIHEALESARLNRNLPMSHSDFLEMTMYHHLAYENILRGSASEESWGCLALASNIALILAELGYGEEHIGLIQSGQDGLLRAKSRGEQAGSWRLDGMAAKEMGEVIEVLDAQLEIATRGEIVEARNIILQRMADQEAASAAA